MKVVRPIQTDAADLVSSNVVNVYADWDSSGNTTYNTGDRVVYERSVYESLEKSNTDNPKSGSEKSTPSWTRLGYSNTWRMFREGSDSRSTATGNIDATVTPGGLVSAVGMLGLKGESVRVRLDDPNSGMVYDETKSLVDAEVSNLWDYFFLPYEIEDRAVFLDLPAYPGADLRMEVIGATTSSDVEFGRAVYGVSTDGGTATADTESKILDFSQKTRDDFGNLQLVPRRTIRLIDYAVFIDSDLVNSIQRIYRDLSATPALYIGREDMPETIVYGVIDRFRVIITGISVTDYSLSVEEF
ncbi:hypothetical protein SLPG_00036 [Salicola phage CGphi29]|uniref:hypothetical protein n=1 Tax=Salicola phage CGphi29 TaxID=754067 RepID=UPI0002C0B0AC|nr:hypothetical protein SLPG_00036 [Salicola phage CGphi29]AGH31830.1 hypothetical protein SLPG_00036 [Salicola phage CGphi29]